MMYGNVSQRPPSFDWSRVVPPTNTAGGGSYINDLHSAPFQRDGRAKPLDALRPQLLQPIGAGGSASSSAAGPLAGASWRADGGQPYPASSQRTPSSQGGGPSPYASFGASSGGGLRYEGSRLGTPLGSAFASGGAVTGASRNAPTQHHQPLHTQHTVQPAGPTAAVVRPSDLLVPQMSSDAGLRRALGGAVAGGGQSHMQHGQAWGPSHAGMGGGGMTAAAPDGHPASNPRYRSSTSPPTASPEPQPGGGLGHLAQGQGLGSVGLGGSAGGSAWSTPRVQHSHATSQPQQPQRPIAMSALAGGGAFISVPATTSATQQQQQQQQQQQGRGTTTHAAAAEDSEDDDATVRRISSGSSEQSEDGQHPQQHAQQHHRHHPQPQQQSGGQQSGGRVHVYAHDRTPSGSILRPTAGAVSSSQWPSLQPQRTSGPPSPQPQGLAGPLGPLGGQPQQGGRHSRSGSRVEFDDRQLGIAAVGSGLGPSPPQGALHGLGPYVTSVPPLSPASPPAAAPQAYATPLDSLLPSSAFGQQQQQHPPSATFPSWGEAGSDLPPSPQRAPRDGGRKQQQQQQRAQAAAREAEQRAQEEQRRLGVIAGLEHDLRRRDAEILQLRLALNRYSIANRSMAAFAAKASGQRVPPSLAVPAPGPGGELLLDMTREGADGRGSAGAGGGGGGRVLVPPHVSGLPLAPVPFHRSGRAADGMLTGGMWVLGTTSDRDPDGPGSGVGGFIKSIFGSKKDKRSKGPAPHPQEGAMSGSVNGPPGIGSHNGSFGGSFASQATLPPSGGASAYEPPHTQSAPQGPSGAAAAGPYGLSASAASAGGSSGRAVWKFRFVVADDRGLTIFKTPEDFQQHCYHRALASCPYSAFEYFVPRFSNNPAAADGLAASGGPQAADCRSLFHAAADDTTGTHFGFIPRQPVGSASAKPTNPTLLLRLTSSRQEADDWIHFLARQFNRRLYRETFPMLYMGAVEGDTVFTVSEGTNTTSHDLYNLIAMETGKELIAGPGTTPTRRHSDGRALSPEALDHHAASNTTVATRAAVEEARQLLLCELEERRFALLRACSVAVQTEGNGENDEDEEALLGAVVRPRGSHLSSASRRARSTSDGAVSASSDRGLTPTAEPPGAGASIVAHHHRDPSAESLGGGLTTGTSPDLAHVQQHLHEQAALSTSGTSHFGHSTASLLQPADGVGAAVTRTTGALAPGVDIGTNTEQDPTAVLSPSTPTLVGNGPEASAAAMEQASLHRRLAEAHEALADVREQLATARDLHELQLQQQSQQQQQSFPSTKDSPQQLNRAREEVAQLRAKVDHLEYELRRAQQDRQSVLGGTTPAKMTASRSGLLLSPRVDALSPPAPTGPPPPNAHRHSTATNANPNTRSDAFLRSEVIADLESELEELRDANARLRSKLGRTQRDYEAKVRQLCGQAASDMEAVINAANEATTAAAVAAGAGDGGGSWFPSDGFRDACQWTDVLRPSLPFPPPVPAARRLDMGTVHTSNASATVPVLRFGLDRSGGVATGAASGGGGGPLQALGMRCCFDASTTQLEGHHRVAPTATSGSSSANGGDATTLKEGWAFRDCLTGALIVLQLQCVGPSEGFETQRDLEEGPRGGGGGSVPRRSTGPKAGTVRDREAGLPLKEGGGRTPTGVHATHPTGNNNNNGSSTPAQYFRQADLFQDEPLPYRSNVERVRGMVVGGRPRRSSSEPPPTSVGPRHHSQDSAPPPTAPPYDVLRLGPRPTRASSLRQEVGSATRAAMPEPPAVQTPRPERPPESRPPVAALPFVVSSKHSRRVAAAGRGRRRAHNNSTNENHHRITNSRVARSRATRARAVGEWEQRHRRPFPQEEFEGFSSSSFEEDDGSGGDRKDSRPYDKDNSDGYGTSTSGSDEDHNNSMPFDEDTAELPVDHHRERHHHQHAARTEGGTTHKRSGGRGQDSPSGSDISGNDDGSFSSD